MKKYFLAICLLNQLCSFAQIQFDSCFVYRNVEKKELKENNLLWEFWQLSGGPYTLEKMSSADAQTLNIAVNRAANMNFSIPKLPENPVYVRCHSKGVVYGFVMIASKRVMIDVAKNMKLVFENQGDLDFINRLDGIYSKK